MTKPVEVHVEQVVLHGRTDAAAVERAIVDQVTRALEERGVDAGFARSREVESLDAPARDASPRSIGRSVALSLSGGRAS